MTSAYASIGHGRTSAGGYDPGTQGGGAVEHVQARRVVAHAAAELTRLRVSHRADGCPDGGHAHAPNWSGSAIRANGIGGLQVAVEVHFDWIRAPRGGFGIHDGSPAGRTLADAIAARWKAAGMPRRAHQNRPGLGFIRNTLPTAILWECDRIGPHTDAELETMGRAIAAGIADIVSPPPPTPPASTIGATMFAKKKLVHIGQRSGAAYEVVDDPHNSGRYALKLVPDSSAAEAITGDARWSRHTVVMTSAQASRYRKLR